MFSKNFIQVGLLGTDIQNFGEMRLILYNINLFEKYDQYQKNVLKQNSFILCLDTKFSVNIFYG